MPVVPLELPAYQRKENWGAAETFYQLVRALAGPSAPPPGTQRERAPGQRGRAATCSAPPRSASATATTCARSRRLLAHARRRRQRRRAAGRHARRPRAPGRGRLQRRALSGDRGAGRALAARAPSASRAPRPCRSASARRATSSREVAALAGIDPPPALDDRALALHLVLALGRFDLPHRQARLRLRRRHARGRRGARRVSQELGFTVVGLGTYSREFAREVREAAKLLRRRGADHRRLSRGRGDGRRAAARAGARHADGAPHRQAPGHPLRGDLGAGARAGLPGALLAADGLRRRQRALRHLGASADDGPGGAPARRCSAATSSSTTAPRRRTSATAARAAAARRAAAASERPPPAEAVVVSGWAPDAEKELQQDPVLRARQGAPQHRALRRTSAASPLITVETLYDAKAHFGR